MKKQRFTPVAALILFAGSAQTIASGPLFPAVFELSSLDGSNGFVLNGANAGAGSGRSVSSAGDVNGDGIADLIIGAPHADPNNQNYAGETFVVFGAPNLGADGVINLSSLNGANGFVINGVAEVDFSGGAVSGAGDVNGDGIDDLIVGARFAGPSGLYGSGEAYVVFGGVGIGAGGVMELSSLNGTNGFVLSGAGRAGRTGYSVSSAGDVNGDGITDLIIGAPNLYLIGGVFGAGESFVVFGAANLGASGSINLSTLTGANGFMVEGDDECGHLGRSVSDAGDVNGDGVGDLIIGTPDAGGHTHPGPDYNNHFAGSGKTYVVSGATSLGASGLINVNSLFGGRGFVLSGVREYDFAGASVSSVGDVNGDGLDDLIIGARGADPNANTNAGASYVVFGAANLGASGSFDLSTLNGANGFILNGANAYDYAGVSVSSAGDVNGDGVADLIIGAYFADPNGQSKAGESYVVFGDAGLGASGSFDLSTLNGSNGFVLNGVNVDDLSGRSVSSAGDVNADGIDDLIIGAFLADPNGKISAGESYVVFGRHGNRGDLNGDCIVGRADLSIMIGGWGPCLPRPAQCAADINHDGMVNVFDLAELVGSWGP